MGIGTTSPDELLHIATTGGAEGAHIAQGFIGNDVNDISEMIVANYDVKDTFTSFSLKQTNTGETTLNSTSDINFSVNDNLVGVFDSSGNLGVGITTPTALLHVGGNSIIDGNLTVNGNLTSINSETIEVEDPQILLAVNNPSDVIDIGFIGQYVDSGTTKFTGLFRDASSVNKSYDLFENLEEKPTTTINTGGVGYRKASLNIDGLDLESGITFSQTDSIIKHNSITIIGNEPQIFLDITGNVGIGTTNPSYELDVDGDINLTGSLLVNGTTFSGSLWEQNGSDIYYDSGNVGIGITNPTFELDVSGDINTTNEYLINGTSVLSSTTLGSGIVNSSLTNVGTLSSLTMGGDIDLNSNNINNINNVVATGITGNVLTQSQTNITDVGTLNSLSMGGNIDLNTNDIIDANNVVATGITGTILTQSQPNITTVGNLTSLTIDGDLTVNGTTTTINSETVSVEDSMLKLANSNTTDTIDAGIYSLYNDGTTKFSGYFRDATDGIIKFYNGLEVEPTTIVDTGATGFDFASLQVKDIGLNEIRYSTDLTFTNSGSPRLVLTPNGFLGIGTTAEYPLHITTLNPSNWSARFINTPTEVFVANSDGNGISINSGVANSNTSLNVNVRNATTNNVFVVRNDDKVGILTSTPERTFHVNIGVTGDGGKIGNAFIGNYSGNPNIAVFSHDDLSQNLNDYAIRQDSSGQTILNASTGQSIRFNINNTEQVTLSSSGNLGVGVTNPTNKFEVNGNSTMTASSSNTLSLINTLTSVDIANADGSGILTNSTTSSNYGISIQENGSALFQVNNDGNVGIGVTNPIGRFEVVDNIIVSNSSNNILGITADTNNLIINANDLLSVGVSNINTFNIDTNNNIGIGTTLPDVKLDVRGDLYVSNKIGIGITNAAETFHVVGDGRFTGDLTIDGNLIFDGIIVENLAIQDPLIKLAANNTGDNVDTGLYSLYIDTGTTKFSGLFRDATDGKYNLFHELEVEPGVTIDTGATGYTNATLVVDTLEAITEVTAPEFNATCDERVKENIQTINIVDSYEKINNLSLYSYNFIKEYNNNEDVIYGLIAQDVEKYIPEAIKQKRVKIGNKVFNDFKIISQNTIMTNLIGTVQYQNKLIENLTKRITDLEK